MVYLILSNIYVSLFFAFYWVALRKQTFFRWNRIYLLTGLCLAFNLPLLSIPAWFNDTTVYPRYFINEGNAIFVQSVPTETVQPGTMDWKELVILVYVTGCILSSLLFLLRLWRTFQYLRSFTDGEAFSFFYAIRVDRNLAGHEQMEAHERVHAREWHSADLLIIQLVKIGCWFNPVVYAYERALGMQHEFIADHATAKDDKVAYAELLVASALNVESAALIHTFSSRSWLKMRVSMLLQGRSHRQNLCRYLVLIPLTGMMAIASMAFNMPSARGSAHSGRFAADTTRQLSESAQDLSLFGKYLSEHIEYPEKAIRNKKEGMYTFSFEKGRGGHIRPISFLNELWEGQNEQVTTVLQAPSVDTLIPAGKYVATIAFRLAGNAGKPDAEFPPPPPVEPEFTVIPPLTIMAYSNEEREDPEIDNLFQRVEIQPEPDGGMKSFMEYVAANYDYPEEAIEAGVNGKVVVAFVVERDGSLTDLKLVEDLGYGTGEAALRVLKNGPRWSPGIQRGRPVRVAYTLPLRFNLQR